MSRYPREDWSLTVHGAKRFGVTLEALVSEGSHGHIPCRVAQQVARTMCDVVKTAYKAGYCIGGSKVVAVESSTDRYVITGRVNVKLDQNHSIDFLFEVASGDESGHIEARLFVRDQPFADDPMCWDNICSLTTDSMVEWMATIARTAGVLAPTQDVPDFVIGVDYRE